MPTFTCPNCREKSDIDKLYIVGGTEVCKRCYDQCTPGHSLDIHIQSRQAEEYQRSPDNLEDSIPLLILSVPKPGIVSGIKLSGPEFSKKIYLL